MNNFAKQIKIRKSDENNVTASITLRSYIDHNPRLPQFDKFLFKEDDMNYTMYASVIAVKQPKRINYWNIRNDYERDSKIHDDLIDNSSRLIVNDKNTSNVTQNDDYFSNHIDSPYDKHHHTTSTNSNKNGLCVDDENYHHFDNHIDVLWYNSYPKF